MNPFLPMMLLGLISSVHCIAMCGPLVLTYAIRQEAQSSRRGRLLPHAAYHAARIASYVLVGLLLGAVGSALGLARFQGWATVLAGLLMILIGVNMTGLFPSLGRLGAAVPTLVERLLRRRDPQPEPADAKPRTRLGAPIAFGLLTGLMPCGPLQAAQLTAIAAGSAVGGAATMLGFAAGTLPLMLGFGMVSSTLGARPRRYLTAAAAVVVIVLGLGTLNRGAVLVGYPVTADSIRLAVLGDLGGNPAQASAIGADGVATVRMIIRDTAYHPDVVSIPSNRPVRLIVDRREADPCSDQIAVPQLGVLADLGPNAVTVVDLPATKAGVYAMTCGMGMMSGRIESGQPRAATPSLLLIASLALGVTVTALALARRRKSRRSPHGG